MKYQNFLFEEYKQADQKPVYFRLGKEKIIIPSSYEGDVDKFTDDLFNFQDKEYEKYERYNASHPDAAIEIPEPLKVDNFYIQPPLDSVLKGMSDNQIIEKVLRTAVRNYRAALKKTLRARKEYPHATFLSTLDPSYLRELDRFHHNYCRKQLQKNLTKVFRWGAGQTANILAGAAGALPAAAYYLLDKKVHFADTTMHRFFKQEALPYIRKGALKALIPISVAAAVELAPKISNKYKEKAVKEQFLEQHHTTNEAFYHNYNTVKEHENEIVCLLSCSEDFRDKAYQCQAGEWTIGYGSRRLADGTKVREGMTITKEEAFAAVVSHSEKYVYPQLEHIKHELSPNQLAAVCSFIYNTDEQAFSNSRVCKAINAKASDNEMRQAFSMYRSVNGSRSYGLIAANGYRGYLWCTDIKEVLTKRPTFIGSPDMRYYEMKDKRNPQENSDGSFIPLDVGVVHKGFQKFNAPSIDSSVIGNMPPQIKLQLTEKYGISEQEGRLSLKENDQAATPKNKDLSFAREYAKFQSRGSSK